MKKISALNRAMVIWCAGLATFVLVYQIWTLTFRTAPDYFSVAMIKIIPGTVGFLVFYGFLAQNAFRQKHGVRKLNLIAGIWWTALAGVMALQTLVPCPTCDEYAGQRFAITILSMGLIASVHWFFQQKMQHTQ
ncbi:hypothetical protein [Leisingera sp. ANG59]|uniref:hypothetical protein n=1 Tax=Leisingera sp. ANG59 TaxID=2675221 RepID=UPI00157388E0|nr:hypothetical protein [Leisingera sp. ANG59]NSY37934.1 hypothetical protein [Leisingera sp. ANG59]